MKQRPPSRVKFLLCDDVRAETSGKMTVVGLYPADKIIVHTKGRDDRPAGSPVAVLHQLAVVCLLFDGSGTHLPKVSLFGPSGQKIVESTMSEVTLNKDVSATIVLQGPQFVVPEFGTFKAKFVIGSKEFDYQFDIAAAPEQDSTAKEVPTIPKRKRSK